MAVIRRDLTRYYAGARATLQRLNFANVEAYFLCQALCGAGLDATSARFLWAVVDERVRDPKGTLIKDGTTMDGERALHVVEQLRGISPLDALAVLDAVEVYWDTYLSNGNDIKEALRASRLSTEVTVYPEDHTP